MSAFDQLDPLVQHHIVNTLGWRELRPLQELSIGPILAGEHGLLLAPTAGGKTEAAIFPVLSRICSEGWTGLSVVYVCPLKALLNNLHVRLESYAAMVGRRCGTWHGDVSASDKKGIKRDPPDILLTTPESLEVMLIAVQPDAREMLKSTRVVVVDEIHAFAGDDRGWHLLSLLERLTVLAGRELQRIGLSATVGNPAALLDWLAGHCQGECSVVHPAEAAGADADIQLDYVGTIKNAAVVISRLYRGEKRLVFCDSRSRVEDLGNELRALDVTTFLSHSSLSATERRESEKAFAEAADCVIVATSTLELGIDVGDLDRVIQIDAPNNVASFLQRIGRTGRRGGKSRNCLFLATTDTALLKAAALIQLWQAGYVEPIIPPPRPLHILAQQIMALALQEKGIGVHDWHRWIGRLPPFAEETEDVVQPILDHLLQRHILFSDGIRLSFGDKGQELYGRRHFLELISTFTSPPIFTVLHGRNELGTVDQITFLRQQPEQPIVLALGGRSWEVSSLDWKKRLAYVIPSQNKGKSRWTSGNIGMPYRICQAIHRVLTDRTVPSLWSQRASERLLSLRADHAFLEPDRDVIVATPQSTEASWYTFAGSIINQALAEAVARETGAATTVHDFWVRIADAARLPLALEHLRQHPGTVTDQFEIPDELVQGLKFNECLPGGLGQELLRERIIHNSQITETLDHIPRDNDLAPDSVPLNLKPKM